MSFSRPSLDDLVTRTKADFEARLGTNGSVLRRAFIAVLARVYAGLIHLLYGYMDYVSRQLFPDTADSDYLRRQATFYGVPPKVATFATGNVVFTGATGSLIPASTQLQRSDSIVFTTNTDLTLITTTGSVAVTSATAGLTGNTDPAVVLQLVSPIAGINSSAPVDSSGITGGTDAETDSDLLNRLLQRIQNSPQGGSNADYVRWALEVAGVTRAWVYPLYMGPGTVGVAFVRDNDVGSIFPDSTEVAQVKTYVDNLRPVGPSDTFVFGPTNYAVNMSIHISPDTPAIRAAVRAELIDLFQRAGSPGGTIYISQINEAISVATGEVDHTLSVPSGNVVPPAYNLPTLGTITWL